MNLAAQTQAELCREHATADAPLRIVPAVQIDLRSRPREQPPGEQ